MIESKTYYYLNKVNSDDKFSKKEYKELVELVNYHNDLYVNKNTQEITDGQYDSLYFKLKELEKNHPEWLTNNSQTQNVKAKTSNKLNKIKHLHPMLSLDKANTNEEVKEFLNKFSSNKNDLWYTDKFLLENKEDGLTLVMYFNEPKVNHGKFTVATRGGGDKGEDVTKNIINIKGMKDIIKKVGNQKLVVRGEAIINNKDFEEINTDGNYMSPRNLVAGSIRTLDDTIAAKRKVRFIAYNIENANNLKIKTQLEQLNKLKEFGFDTEKPLAILDNTEKGKKDLVSFIDNFTSDDRLKIGHDIDGIVIKPNNITNREKIGYTTHHPKNTLAYKFASPDAITILRKVVWQGGSKGRLTPVGIFDEVELLGSKVKKASLVSFSDIQKRDIRVGDKIVVERRNDVIPKIMKSLPEQRVGNEKKVPFPKNAKKIGELEYTIVKDDEQKLSGWKNFVSKNAMNIDGLSKSLIKLLVDNNLLDIDDYSSLYKLFSNDSRKEEFINIKGLGEQRWNKIKNEIEKSKEIEFSHVLVAMNIKGIGKTFSKDFTEQYSFNDLYSAEKNTSVGVLQLADSFIFNNKGYGKATSDALMELTNSKNWSIVLKLKKYGVKMNTVKNNEINKNISNKTFVITGTMNIKKRSEWQEIIEKLGGKLGNSVTSKTDYLVANKISNSSKFKKAKELLVPIINENQLNNFVNNK